MKRKSSKIILGMIQNQIQILINSITGLASTLKSKKLINLPLPIPQQLQKKKSILSQAQKMH